MNEKRELKIKNLVTKDGKVYKKDDMPIEIILSTEIEKISFPQNIVKLEVYETSEETEEYLFPIYIGEVFYRQTIQSLSPTFQFSQEKDNTPYVFVPNSNGSLVLVAKLNRGDMVVENINQLKMLLAELTEKHQKRLIGVSRIKEVNMKENIILKIINTNSKGFSFLKDKSNSPFVLELPCDLESVEFPNNILKLEVFEKQDGKEEYICAIYVGEVYPERIIKSIHPNYRYCENFDVKTLKDIRDDSPCVFYKDVYNNYVLVAKLDLDDIVVPDTTELKEFLMDLSNILNDEKGLKRTKSRKEIN